MAVHGINRLCKGSAAWSERQKPESLGPTAHTPPRVSAGVQSPGCEHAPPGCVSGSHGSFHARRTRVPTSRDGSLPLCGTVGFSGADGAGLGQVEVVGGSHVHLVEGRRGSEAVPVLKRSQLFLLSLIFTKLS